MLIIVGQSGGECIWHSIAKASNREDKTGNPDKLKIKYWYAKVLFECIIIFLMWEIQTLIVNKIKIA